MYSNKKNDLDEIKKDIEFKVWKIDNSKTQYDLAETYIVHKWFSYQYANSRISGEPLYIGIAIEYEKNSKTFEVTIRKDTDEYKYLEEHPIEAVHKLECCQGLSIENAIEVGKKLNEKLEIELFGDKKNSVEKTEIKLDENQKTYDSEIEL